MSTPSYYGYVSRGLSTEVDWLGISTDLQNTFKETLIARDEKRKELDDASRQWQQQIMEAPEGLHLGMNDAMANLANDLMEVTLMQDKLFKNGEMSLKDYTTARQNLMDDTRMIYKGFAKFMEGGDEVTQRTLDGKNWQIESRLFDKYGAGIDFQTHNFYIDSHTGRIFHGKRNPDNLNEVLPGSLETVSSMGNSMSLRFDKFDTKKWIQDLATSKNVAVFQEAFADGSTISDVRRSKLGKFFEEYKSAEADYILNDQYRLGSVLFSDLQGVRNSEGILVKGKEYKFANSKEEFENDKTGTLIWEEPSANGSGYPQLHFQDSQIKAAKEYLEGRIDMSVGYKETAARGDGSGTGAGKYLSGGELLENIYEFVASDDDATRKNATSRLIENANRDYKNMGDKTITNITAEDWNNDGQVDSYVVYATEMGQETIDKVDVSGEGSEQSKINTLYDYLKPKGSKEDFNNAVEQYGGWGNWNEDYTDSRTLFEGSETIKIRKPKRLSSIKHEGDTTYTTRYGNEGDKKHKIKPEEMSTWLTSELGAIGNKLGIEIEVTDVEADKHGETPILLKVNGIDYELPWPDKRGSYRPAEGVEALDNLVWQIQVDRNKSLTERGKTTTTTDETIVQEEDTGTQQETVVETFKTTEGGFVPTSEVVEKLSVDHEGLYAGRKPVSQKEFSEITGITLANAKDTTGKPLGTVYMKYKSSFNNQQTKNYPQIAEDNKVLVRKEKEYPYLYKDTFNQIKDKDGVEYMQQVLKEYPEIFNKDVLYSHGGLNTMKLAEKIGAKTFNQSAFEKWMGIEKGKGYSEYAYFKKALPQIIRGMEKGDLIDLGFGDRKDVL